MLLLKCRCCNSNQLEQFLDLGLTPISNDYTKSPEIQTALHPLKVVVCNDCSFLQLSEEIDPSTHFNSRYPYFSGYSRTWVEHCQITTASLAARFEIGFGKQVIEIASNDGTFVKNFKKFDASILGIEPSQNVAAHAELQGVPTIVEFFTEDLARRLVETGTSPDLIIGCNVLAHVPNIRDFLKGIAVLLKGAAVAVFEFPHATQMIEHGEFDTIYHEHYSYLNLIPLKKLCSELGLEIFDVETHDLHGGSLRIFLSVKGSPIQISSRVENILDYERNWLPTSIYVREKFQIKVKKVLSDFKAILDKYQTQNFKIVIFGAAAKGSTLLNVAKIDSKIVAYAVDSSVEKQNKYIPGTGILILSPEELRISKPDVIIILAWNFAEEIMKQANEIFNPTHSFLIPFPNLKEIPCF